MHVLTMKKKEAMDVKESKEEYRSGGWVKKRERGNGVIIFTKIKESIPKRKKEKTFWSSVSMGHRKEVLTLKLFI